MLTIHNNKPKSNFSAEFYVNYIDNIKKVHNQEVGNVSPKHCNDWFFNCAVRSLFFISVRQQGQVGYRRYCLKPFGEKLTTAIGIV
jgi:hypothetical protein